MDEKDKRRLEASKLAKAAAKYLTNSSLKHADIIVATDWILTGDPLWQVWLKYHPFASEHTARVHAAKIMKSIDVADLAEVVGLGVNKLFFYIEKLEEAGEYDKAFDRLIKLTGRDVSKHEIHIDKFAWLDDGQE